MERLRRRLDERAKHAIILDDAASDLHTSRIAVDHLECDLFDHRTTDVDVNRLQRTGEPDAEILAGCDQMYPSSGNDASADLTVAQIFDLHRTVAMQDQKLVARRLEHAFERGLLLHGGEERRPMASVAGRANARSRLRQHPVRLFEAKRLQSQHHSLPTASAADSCWSIWPTLLLRAGPRPHTRSSATAIPCPTPIHMVASAMRLPVRNSSKLAVPTMRPPDMPKG